jgi:hypothetical protein
MNEAGELRAHRKHHASLPTRALQGPGVAVVVLALTLAFAGEWN